jgi:hypothetical protein
MPNDNNASEYNHTQKTRNLDLKLSSSCYEILKEVSEKDAKSIGFVAAEILEYQAVRLLKNGYLDEDQNNSSRGR